MVVVVVEKRVVEVRVVGALAVVVLAAAALVVKDETDYLQKGQD